MSAKSCQWCGSDTGCDCEDRATCPQAGEPLHNQCGRKSCGCPRFVTCGHARMEVLHKEDR